MARLMRHTENPISFKIYAIIAVLFCCFGIASSVNAASMFAPDACDPQYYQSLESRAWLEAQREITQNQNLIFKSDSVLEYTCFDRYLNQLAATSVNMFSESSRWGSPPGDMAASLNNLVGNAARGYLASNFNHNLLGGRANGGISGNASDTLTYTPSASVSGGGYACDTMNNVWRIAKCMGFTQSAANDAFFTFAEYAAGADKRFLPTRCNPSSTSSPEYQDNINEAVVDSETDWDEDVVRTYFDLIYPTASGSSLNCGGPASRIATGLLVSAPKGVANGSNTVNFYAEHICLVPGCHFVPTANYPALSYNRNTGQPGECRSN